MKSIATLTLLIDEDFNSINTYEIFSNIKKAFTALVSDREIKINILDDKTLFLCNGERTTLILSFDSHAGNLNGHIYDAVRAEIKGNDDCNTDNKLTTGNWRNAVIESDVREVNTCSF